MTILRDTNLLFAGQCPKALSLLLSLLLCGGLCILPASLAFAHVFLPRAYTDHQAMLSSPSAVDGGSSVCSFPRPYTGALAFPSRYEGSGNSRDKVNPVAEKSYLSQTESMIALQRMLVLTSDRIIQGKGGKAEMDCIVACLLSWARKSTLLTQTDDHTGKAVRKWTLAAVSSNLVKIWDILAAHEKRSDLDEIQQWLGKLADVVVADYSEIPLLKTNNHHYWAAWAVMATSALLNRDDLYIWSREMFMTAINQVDGYGFLPNELKRKKRAKMYHNYALAPLIGIAVFMDANGDDPFAPNEQALSRLVSTVLDSVDSDGVFLEATGSKQKDSVLTEKGRLAWLAMYHSFANRGPSDLAQRVQDSIANGFSLRSTRLGGDLGYIFLQ